jgi:hypothetical protein
MVDLFESFATATFTWDPLKDLPMHPVTFYNLKTQAPVKIDMLPDTGASVNVLDAKYAKLLGVDEAAAPKASIEGIGDQSKQGFIALLPMRIANLAVVVAQVTFISGLPVNVLGRHQGFSHYRTTFTWNKLYYEELAKKQAATATKAAAFARSYAAFRGRR